RDEHMGSAAAVGIPLALGGVYLVAARSGTAPVTAASAGRGYWVGVGLAAAAAVSWSCSTLALGPALALVDVPTASAVRTPLASALLFFTARRAGVLPKVDRLRARALLALLAPGFAPDAATALLWLRF